MGRMTESEDIINNKIPPVTICVYNPKIWSLLINHELANKQMDKINDRERRHW